MPSPCATHGSSKSAGTRQKPRRTVAIGKKRSERRTMTTVEIRDEAEAKGPEREAARRDHTPTEERTPPLFAAKLADRVARGREFESGLRCDGVPSRRTGQGN